MGDEVRRDAPLVDRPPGRRVVARGGERQAELLIRALQDLGQEQVLIARAGRPLAERLADAGIRIAAFDRLSEHARSSRRLLNDLRTLRSRMDMFGRNTQQVAEFLQNNPKAYAVLAGFTDSTGDPEYNLQLSRMRAQSAKNYILEQSRIDPDRVVLMWYGAANYIADNATPEGRASNRRISLAWSTPSQSIQ